MRIRYARWSGTQEPFPTGVTADEVLSELSDDLLGGLGADRALERLLRRGLSGRVAGLDALRRRVEAARRRELSRMGLESPLRRVAERLDEILDRERTALAFDADSARAAQKLDQLDDLPSDIAARLGALERYDWTDPQAGEDFRALLDQLRRDVAQATFGRLASALGSMTAADLQRMRDLLADLNAMIAKRDRGEDVTEDFARFKQRYPDVVGDAETLEELLDELARRMAAMSSLMAGLDPVQRGQLAAMASQLLGDLDLAFQTQQLQRALEGIYPQLSWRTPPEGAWQTGDEESSLSEAVDWIEHLQSYEDLSKALGQEYPGARLEDIDPEALRQALGDEAVRDLHALREIERVLEQTGAARRHHGRLELTPRGIRKLGERTLATIYDRAVTGATGAHRTPASGGDGELTGSTRPLRFGDPFRLDVGRAIRNGMLREAGWRVVAQRPPTGRDPTGRAVQLTPDDFELAEAERRVRVATVLLLDMSFSMPLRGNWVPAKRVALALASLVSSKFPEDRFYVVGFSDYARQLQPRDLIATGWERVYGTNMQHALMIARRLLGAHPGAERQVIMVTDGEPTAHLEGDAAYFAWPPEPKTLRLTIAEAARLSRTGATLNVFLLDHDPGSGVFVERMVSAYGGRIFYPDLDNLGNLVVRDFLRRRS
ncbi:MAG: vWA domain-containing protein [Egibacteraceae bacterium]